MTKMKYNKRKHLFSINLLLCANKISMQMITRITNGA